MRWRKLTAIDLELFFYDGKVSCLSATLVCGMSRSGQVSKEEWSAADLGTRFGGCTASVSTVYCKESLRFYVVSLRSDLVFKGAQE